MGTIVKPTPKENILEYQSDSHGIICSNQEIFVASAIDKWLFPGKIYTIPTHSKIWLPDNSAAILTRCPWLNHRLEVVPQNIVSDSFIYVQVRNIGLLPVKIVEEEMLGYLTIVSRLECHIIDRGQS